MDSITFGELIRKHRKKQGLTLREVAAFINYDQSTLNKVEKNEVIPPSKIVRPLAKCLDLDYKNLQIKYLSEKLFRELKEADYVIEALEVLQKRVEQEHDGTTFELQREKIIEKIKQYLHHKPIEKAWLFGSFARKEESYDSDIDLLIRFVHPNKIDLFEYIGMKQDLEDLSGRQIDFVEEGQELPKIKPVIEKEKQLIYERQTN